MKILHITAFALRGGCEKNCYHFCNQESEAEHEIIVLDQPGPMSEEWNLLGIKVRHLEILKENLLSFGKLLRLQIGNQKYNLVILWSTIRMPLQLNALRHATQSIRVYLGNPLKQGYNPKKDKLLQFIFPYSGAVTLMACSSYVAKSHERNSYFGKFALKVSLNPVALPSDYPKKEFEPDVFKLGMVARLDPIKDHNTVLLAFSEIIKTIPSARLHLVGDGILRDHLKDEANAAGIGDKVVFHGDVADVYHFLNQWDVFVYATTRQEGLGSVVEEAMANGLPCVLSDLPMLKELAPEPDLVRWFSEGNPAELAAEVKKLYTDDALRNRLGRSAFDYAHKHFSAKRFIADYLSE